MRKPGFAVATARSLAASQLRYAKNLFVAVVGGVVFGRAARASVGAGGVAAGGMGVVGGLFVVAAIGVLGGLGVVLGGGGVVVGGSAVVVAGGAFFGGGSHDEKGVGGKVDFVRWRGREWLKNRLIKFRHFIA